MTETLKKQQQKLVEENHDLIYIYLDDNNLSTDDIEDWYGIAAIGLCKAALIYDENQEIEFREFANTIIDQEIKTAKQA